MYPDVTPNATPRSTPTKTRKTPTMTLSSSNTPPSSPPSPNAVGPLRRAITSPLTTPLDRSFSGESILSSGSSQSNNSNRSSVMTTTSRRRGYMRPQGTEFSRSARSRDSVMALGSIAHLQYFFAKTGLLDGRGGGLQTKKERESMLGKLGEKFETTSDLRDSTYSSLRSSPELYLPGEEGYLMDSPSELEDYDFDDSIMLPPTTSTYNPQAKHIAPAPDPDVLRKRLRQSLGANKTQWEKAGVIPEGGMYENFLEIQGSDLCEMGTSVIRAAKTYYYSTDISLLSTKDDKTLREEFLGVLDVLKRMAQRKFEGGVTPEERDAVLHWICGVETSLDEEEKAIKELRRKGRDWLEGSWEGREYERYHLFMSYFDSSETPLPPHTPTEGAESLPTPFLASLQTGLRLILIHNAVVRRSKRPFGQIPTFHTEFSKPYRLVENLRYWKKAAEIRFGLKLKFDPVTVVNATDDGWKDLERDVGIWCNAVLEEVRKDWAMGEGAAAVGQVRASRSHTMASMKVEIGDQLSIV
ncbi:hypothetical protein BZA77DRAFT_243785 [Pyronema omphalodes]|nr:hypothetical protein BZA77DRAFT_243785 [Pyronema omphalodes]